MQTFLPYASFEKSARCLDRARLGKQRIEALQILRALRSHDPKTGWANHPATRMWRGCELQLAVYGRVMCDEWLNRGYRDSCRALFASLIDDITLEVAAGTSEARLPTWLGDPAFHASHRSNLLRKDREWYGQFGWSEPADLPYVWPQGAR